MADFDGDGNPDVAFFLAGDFSGILFGGGDGTLPTQANMPSFSPVFPGAPRAVDLNGDQKPDLTFADANVQGLVSLINQWGRPAAGGSATSTTLTVAPSPATVGQSVTLTAAVAAAGTPTGTVSFLDHAVVVGSAAVSAQGSAAFTTTALAAGTHSLTAQYSGDSTFAASAAAAVSLTVAAAQADFTIAASPTSGSVAAGASAAATVTLTPSGGFSGTVALTCAGLPAGAACSFSPASVSLAGTAAAADLTISTATPMAQMKSRPIRNPLDPFAPDGMILAGMMAPFVTRMRRRESRARARNALHWAGILLIGAAALHGCGGGHGSSGGTPPPAGGTPPGNYTITVTATSGSTSHTATYALTVT